MKSRYLVLCLSLVLALALAVPALGGPTNPIASISATVKQTANKALKKAKTAQQTANTALSTANSAQGSAGTASKEADSAAAAAKAAQTTANEAKTAAAAAQSTANSKFGQTFTEFGETDGPNTTSGFAVAVCPAGSEVTGGGYETGGAGSDEVVPNYTAAYGDAWLASLQRIPGQASTWTVRAIVTCAKP